MDTTGAGDAYLGALAAYVSSGVDLKLAMEKAGRVATISIGAKGAQSSYPRQDALPEDLKLP